MGKNFYLKKKNVVKELITLLTEQVPDIPFPVIKTYVKTCTFIQLQYLNTQEIFFKNESKEN